MSFEFLVRNRRLFVSVDGDVQSFETFANGFGLGSVQFNARPVRGRQNSFSIEVPTDLWSKTSDLERHGSMTSLALAMHKAGADPETVRYVSSRKNRNDEVWKPACNIYIDLDTATQGAGGNTVKQDTDALLSSLGEQFMAAGGDLTSIPPLSAPLQVSWLKGQLKALTGDTVETSSTEGEATDLGDESAPI